MQTCGGQHPEDLILSSDSDPSEQGSSVLGRGVGRAGGAQFSSVFFFNMFFVNNTFSTSCELKGLPSAVQGPAPGPLWGQRYNRRGQRGCAPQTECLNLAGSCHLTRSPIFTLREPPSPPAPRPKTPSGAESTRSLGPLAAKPKGAMPAQGLERSPHKS